MAALLSLEETPKTSPGTCRRCGTSYGRQWYINLGYVEDFHGTVYYCDVCVAEIASFAGFTRETELLNRIENLEVLLREQHDKYFNLVRLYDSLSSIGLDLYAILDFLNVRQNPDAKPLREEAAGLRAPGLIEQITGQRPDDLPNDGSNDSKPPTQFIKLEF